MIKIYTAALAVATALNIFYTVYSYNEVNKWRQEVDSRIENTVERVNHIEDRTHEVNGINNRVDSIGQQVKEIQSQVGEKLDSELAVKIDNKMLETMMSFEARVYELELQNIERKLKESVKEK
jgi:chorismate synthase